MKKTTRFTAILLVLVMVMQTCSFAISTSDFKDFPKDWSTEAMTAAVNNGLLIGTSDDTIEPKKNLTRAEMTAIITRAFGATTKMDTSFISDVKSTDWFSDPVAVSYQMGVFNGTRDDLFAPNESIRREDVLLGLSRVLLISSSDYSVLNQFTDKNDIDSWAKDAVAGMIATDLVHGYGNGLLLPRGYITRAELAQMFHNIFKTYIDEPGICQTVAEEGSVIVRVPGVTLRNVTINGDLIIADGVGSGNFNLENVTVNGRILVRGGEGKVTFKNVKATGKVIVNDVNGTVNFMNYRTDAPFAGNLDENTKATFLTPEPTPSSSSSSGGGSTARYYTYYTYHYFQQLDGTYKAQTTLTQTSSGKSGTTVVALTLDADKMTGYTENTTHADRKISGAVVSGLTLKRYYDRIKYAVNFVVDGTTVDTQQVMFEGNATKPADPTAPAGKYFAGWSTDGTVDGIVDVTAYEIKKDDTFTAVFVNEAPVYYDVKFMANGSQVGTTQSVLKNGFATPPTAPDKTGYSFIGWSTDETEANIKNLSSYNITANTTFNAIYKINSYDVKFMVGLTQTGTTQSIEYNKYATAPSDPDAPDGQHFAGWSTDGTEANIKTVASYPITEATTFTAVFKTTPVTKYDVKFMIGSTQYGITQEVIKGNAATKPADPTDVGEGKHFTGWSVDGTTVVDVTTYVINSATTFVALTAADTFTVKFMVEGTQQGGDQTIDYGKFATAPTVTAPEGKTFKGWSVDGTTTVDVATYAIKADTVFTALFSATKYDVKFMVGSAQTGATQSIEYNKYATAPADPTSPDGQYFAGWSIDGTEANIKDVASYAIKEATTFTAVFKTTPVTRYDVKFMVGSVQYGSTQSIVKGGKANKPADPTDVGEGKHFAGWSIDGTTVVDVTTYVINSATTFTALTATDTFTVKFMVSGAQQGAAQTVDYGKFATAPTVTPPTGKTFMGWSVDGVNTVDVATYAIKADTEFTALFTATKFDVKFMANGSQYGTTQSIEYNGNAVKPGVDPTAAAGKTFAGWSIDGATVIDVSTYVITEATTFTAVFTDNEYSVKFMVDGVQLGDTQTLGYNGYATAPTVTVPTGKTFKGWSVDGTTTVDVAAYAITVDTVFTALFETNKYDVKFMVSGSQYGTTQSVEYNKYAEAPTGFTIPAGKNFAGWSIDGTLANVKDVASYPITEATTFTAVFTDVPVVTFEVKFMVGADQYGTTQNVIKGNKATKPSDPTVEVGKVFEGWSIDGTTVVDVTTYAINAATTFKAIIKTATFEVKFMSEGTQYGTTQTVDYNDYADVPTEPTAPEHKYFAGWSTDGTETGIVDVAVYPITENTTFTAFYKDYLIVRFFDEAKDPTLQKTIEVKPNDSISEDKFPEGYTAKGYKKNGTIDSVYAGMDFVHKIDYKWFFDDNGEWTEYVPETPVTESIDVYLRSKFATLVIDLNKFGLDFVAEIPYEADTRAGDAIKDALFINEGYITSAYNHSGAEAKLLEKLRNYDIIDPNTKEILNIDRTVNFVTVLGKDNLNKLIDKQLQDYFNGAGRETLTEFLTNYIKNVNDSNIDEVSANLQSMLNSMLSQKPEETKEIITNAANNIINSDISAFADFIKEYVDSKVATEAGKTEIKNMLTDAFTDYCNTNEAEFKAFVNNVISDMVANGDDKMIDFVVDHVIELIKDGQFQTEIKNQLATMDVAELKSMICELVESDFDLLADRIQSQFESDDAFVAEIVDLITNAKVADFDEKIVEYAKDALDTGDGDLKQKLKDKFLEQWNSFDDATKTQWIQDYIDGLTSEAILDLVKTNSASISAEKLLELVKTDKINISNDKLLEYIKNGTVTIPDAMLLDYIKTGKITVATNTILDAVQTGKVTIPEDTMLDIVKNAVTGGSISTSSIVDLVKTGKLVLPESVVDSIIRDRIKQEAIDDGMSEEDAATVARDYEITDEDRTNAISEVTEEQVDLYLDDVVAGLTYDDIAGYTNDFIADDLTADMIDDNKSDIIDAMDAAFIADYKTNLIDALTSSDIAANRASIMNLVSADDIASIKDEIIDGITVGDIDACRGDLADVLLDDSEVQADAIDAYIDSKFNNLSDVETTIRDLLDTDDGRTLLASVIKDYVTDPANSGARTEIAQSAISILRDNATLRADAVSKYLDKALADETKKADLIQSAVDMLSSNPDVLNNAQVKSVIKDAVKEQLANSGDNDSMISSYVDQIVADRDFGTIIDLFADSDKSFRDDVIDKLLESLNSQPDGKDIITNMVNRMLDSMFAAGSVDIAVVKVTVKYMSDHSDSAMIQDIVDTVSQMDNILDFAESLGYDAVNEKLAEVSKFKNQITTGAQFEVNKDNAFIIQPLYDLVSKMNFDYVIDTYVKPRVPAKVLDNLPLYIAKPIYNRTMQDYIAQLRTALDAANADSVGYVNCGITIKFNPVTEVLMPLYDYAMNSYGKLEDKAQNHGGQITDKYETYIKANPYIDSLLDILDPHNFLSGSDADATSTHSGYSLKEFTDYYQILKSASVLLDDTFLWYCKNVDYADVETVLDRFETRILNYTNLVNSIFVDYAENGIPSSVEEILDQIMQNDIAKGDIEIVGDKVNVDLDYYLDRVAGNHYVDVAYDKLVDRFGARISAVLVKYAESRLNRTYTDEDFQRGKEILYKIYEDEDANITVDYLFDKLIKGDFKSFTFRNNTGSIERTIK